MQSGANSGANLSAYSAFQSDARTAAVRLWRLVEGWTTHPWRLAVGNPEESCDRKIHSRVRRPPNPAYENVGAIGRKLNRKDMPGPSGQPWRDTEIRGHFTRGTRILNNERMLAGKNVLIYSDGTGQRGGLFFDERRTNIYKLYRATRCGPDSCVDPGEQLAFYDPGIGTLPPDLGFLDGVAHWLYNFISQATGLGLTRNIIHCYAAIIRMWQPGDRIFLFGFSRGAYTVRCVAAVLALCGVPTQMKDGTPLKRYAASANNIAKEAVKKVYQHVSSPRDAKYYPQRTALAQHFRCVYGSDDDGKSNAFPHFIGVFDTVAAIANFGSLVLATGISLALIALTSGILALLLSSFWLCFLWLTVATLFGCLIAYLITHIKVAFGLEGYPWWKTFHLTDARMKFYDQQLNPNVGWARHALAIDEHRADFDRVPWARQNKCRRTGPDEPKWLQQFWFSGNHSDVGGSYPENESRLSDIALQWMVEAVMKVPNGIQVDRSVLQPYPSADGMQHDEGRSGVFRYARKIERKIPTDATLHRSVYERFKFPAVLQYDEFRAYRPEGLRNHERLKQYYELRLVIVAEHLTQAD
jgi:uncharacterized protein (DUF2235 family)